VSKQNHVNIFYTALWKKDWLPILTNTIYVNFVLFSEIPFQLSWLLKLLSWTNKNINNGNGKTTVQWKVWIVFEL